MTTEVTTMKRMATRTRMAGLAAIAGGLLALAAAGVLPVYPGADSPGADGYRIFYAFAIAGAALLTAGALGTSFGYRESYGTLGLVGSALAALGFLSATVGSVLNFLSTAAPGETTTGGGFVFVGMIVAMIGSVLLGIALWRVDVAEVAAGLMILGSLAFVAGLIVGATVVESLGIDIAGIVFALAFPLGWIALGNHMRRVSADETDRTTAPVA